MAKTKNAEKSNVKAEKSNVKKVTRTIIVGYQFTIYDMKEDGSLVFVDYMESKNPRVTNSLIKEKSEQYSINATIILNGTIKKRYEMAEEVFIANAVEITE